MLDVPCRDVCRAWLCVLSKLSIYFISISFLYHNDDTKWFSSERALYALYALPALTDDALHLAA